MKKNLGMWVFLCSEVLLFGTLIFLYGIFYYRYQSPFQAASRDLHLLQGTINTFILLTSSYFVALAQVKNKKRWMLFAALLGLVFLGVKGTEYYDLTLQGKFPLNFGPLTQDKRFFFSFYAYLTFLHSIHVLFGIFALALVWIIGEGKNGHSSLQESVGLYWHFVDVVWVFLYPLFYLLGV